MPGTGSLWGQVQGMGLQESPWEKLCGQVILATELFVEQVRAKIGGKETVGEIPRHQRQPM